MLALDDLSTDGEQFRQAMHTGVPYQPLYVKIKLTWRCNLRCQMCTVWQQSAEERLTLPIIQSLAEELASLGTRKVHLSGGEVLLRPDIFAVIAAFAGREMQVNLTTNGTLLTPEVATQLVESGIHNVSISLDGATPAVHDALRGKRNWKRTIRGIRNLRRAAKHARHKLHIRINVVITRHNYRDIAGLPDIAHQAGADRLTLIPVDDATGRLRLNKTRIRAYNKEVAPRLANRALAYGMIEGVDEVYPFGQEKTDLELSKVGLYAVGLYETQPCYIPWLHALIDPQGQVNPCCMLRRMEPMGNLITEKSFRAVWAGVAFCHFRQQLLAPGQRPALCHACDDFLAENRFLHQVVTSP
jgi:MoaA/NifB/PqqE/SkfB family radical SAM enzyme